MSRLTLRLPETLHQQLNELAVGEGVSLNQYIVYALTRQVASTGAVRAIPAAEVSQQKQAFEALLKSMRQASATEIEAALAEREVAQPEAELSPETIARLQQRIRDAKK